MNTLPYVIVILFISIQPNLTYSQNLIPNGSFEITDRVFQSGIKSWINFPPSTAKLIEKDHNGIKAKEGQKQVALTLYSFTKTYGSPLYSSQERGYLQTRLTKPLIKGKIYKFSIAVRLSDSSFYAIDKINVFITKYPNRDRFPLIPNVKVMGKNKGFIANEVNWKIYYGYYKANGGEKYLILGNNNTKNNSKIVNPQLMLRKRDSGAILGKFRYAELKHKLVYFFDNLSLVETDTYDFPIGTEFVIENLLFQTGSAKIPTIANDRLNALSHLLKNHPDLKIEIIGHTDDVGTAASNKRLATERAKVVKSYFLQQGINTKRIWARGIGATNPLSDNKTEEGKAKNRRVEMMIVTN